MTKRRVLIVGAGVAGLAAGWWLGRAGWSVSVVEQAPDLRRDGFMLSLSGPGHQAARQMGLLPALAGHARPIDENVYRDREGREIMRLRYGELLRGVEWITLTRTDLVATLCEACAGLADIQLNRTLLALTQTEERVRATLSDGQELEIDLVIGADGTRSATRALLFPAQGDVLRPLGYRAAAFQIPDRLGIGDDFMSYAEPGRLAELYTLHDGGLATFYAWRSEATAPVAYDDRRAALRAASAGTHPEPLRWIDALPGDAPLYLDALVLVEQKAWSQGRAVLLGDAAHCLTLISGQGAGMAMASAAILAEELQRHDVREALRRHEARLRPSIEGLQARSRKMAGVYIPGTPLAFALRNLLWRWLPHRLLARYLLRNIRSEIQLAGPGLGA